MPILTHPSRFRARVSLTFVALSEKEIGSRDATGREGQALLLGTRVYLELHVIVEANWRESKSFVEWLDWRNQLERLAGDQITEKPSGEEE